MLKTTEMAMLLAVLTLANTAGAADEDFASLKQRFVSPPANAGTVTLWWLNGKLTKETVREQMLAMRDRCGFGGVAPVPMSRLKPATVPEYLTAGYFDIYGSILNTAKELGMKVVFYDDCDYPSGTAGNRLREQHPEALMKYLARARLTVTGPADAAFAMPTGAVLSVVARNLDTGKRSVVTGQARWSDAIPSKPDQAKLVWPAPAGKWEAQAFVCAPEPTARFVDCLDPDAMRKFIALTYDQFAQRFPQHFGSTVKMTFFDDLAVYYAPDCALWTPAFNAKFRRKFGRSPEPLYPALWENIGPDTEAARAHLFGLRNEMFAAGYPGVTEQWCAQHGMKASGHPACAYRANPLQAPGDAILFYKYQGYPLTDYIHYWHHGVDGFKVPASAACNFDQPLTVCEIYGNFHQPLPNNSNMLYRAGMEMYARGINCLLPHGTWLDPNQMRIVPEISWRNPEIGPELPRFNQWAARCETLLRGGRHVADIGIVYPIDDLAARYNFSDFPKNNGRDPIPGTDYHEIMRVLTGELRRDFTLLHPETIDQRCRVDGAEFLLDNRQNWERYKVLLLPACRTIRLSNLEKIKAFHDAGGWVIATTCLPEKSTEFGRDDDVRRLTRRMFGPTGRGIFVAKPDEQTLAAALDRTGLVWDVVIAHAPNLPRRYRTAKDYGGKPPAAPDAYEGGNRQFACIHKVKADADLYYFANSSDLAVSAEVSLRGTRRLELWDPHTGATRLASGQPLTLNGQSVTRLNLELPPIHSLFVVAKP